MENKLDIVQKENLCELVQQLPVIFAYAPTSE